MGLSKPSKKATPSASSLLSDYKDPAAPGSLGGVARFAAAQGISVGRAQRLLENELSYTLHKPRRHRFPTLKVQAEGIDHQWVADLVEMQRLARYNHGVRYLLTVVDVLSKYVWVQPLKAKTGVAMVKAFETILKGRRKPIQLQSDRGKEFYNRPFQSFLKQHNIHHFSTEGDAKAANVERFNRTLKGRMFRYFTAANTLRFDKVLPSLVQGYNASYHRSIGMAPQDVTRRNERAVWRRLFEGSKTTKKKRPRFRVGDRVRLNKKHRTFQKSYLPGWTEKVFVVQRVKPGRVPTYKIQEWDQTPVSGTFYEQDLQKVQAGNDDLFRIEKVLKRRKDRLLVQWKGWPTKYNTWIPKSALQP